jgi:hypothetical protein
VHRLSALDHALLDKNGSPAGCRELRERGGRARAKQRCATSVLTLSSSAATRLLIADATMFSRSAARAMFRSSPTAINIRSVTGSKYRFM